MVDQVLSWAITIALTLISGGVVYHARMVYKTLPAILEAIRRLELTDAHIGTAIERLSENFDELKKATASGFARVDDRAMNHGERISRIEGKVT